MPAEGATRFFKAASAGLSWQDISYSIPARNRGAPRRDILTNVCGGARCGELTVILGPTGSGKSSLLSVLGGRLEHVRGARLTGQVCVHGQPASTRTVARLAAFVAQEDSLPSLLTVEEVLLLSAHLHLPPSTSSSKAEGRSLAAARLADDVIAALGLSKARHTRIGNVLVRGVSGGERKRVSVGVELMSDPPLLLLDEPTSGLDSFQALSVMHALKDLCGEERTVLAAIHQPRSAIFDCIDTLILIAEGRTVYCGAAAGVVAHFSSLGLHCPASRFNPADFLLDALSSDCRTTEAEQSSGERVRLLCEAWEQQRHRQSPPSPPRPVEDKRRLPAAGRQQEELEEEGGGRRRRQLLSWWSQFALLLGRAAKEGFRNYPLHIVKVMMGVSVALTLAAVYCKHPASYAKPMDVAMVQGFIGMLFFMPLFQAFGGAQLTSLLFPAEKALLARERGWYRLSAYYLSRLLCELPLELISPVSFALTSYWALGLQPQRFPVFLAITVLTSFCSSSLGLLVGAASPSMMMAIMAGPPVLVTFFLFGGLFVNVESLPIWLKWGADVSFVRWSFQALCINQFTGLTFRCPAPYTCTFPGEVVLDVFAFDTYTVGECLMALVGIACVFTAAGYLALVLDRQRKYLYIEVHRAATVVVDFSPVKPLSSWEPAEEKTPSSAGQ